MTASPQTEPTRPTRKNRAVIPEAKPEPVREPVRRKVPGRIEVAGRDGKILSRKRKASGDMFAIDPHIIPEGWDYQWNPYTVMGENQIDSQIAMAENGWRPVPAERHPGTFMPEGHTGAILRGGLILEERPMELTMEAKREEELKARAQLRDSKDTLGLTGKLPQGYSDEAHYRGAGVELKNNIVRVNDAPRPQLQIADE